ncbi:beta-1,4-galactosyltransferase galt-1-like [Haliotis rubra]|uniref:beta-1,4-galactosyltransferase galt-1-like n=1 Tax=Haliotis rubra TaxID=36100 RepID=UPI001EE5D505|nr:beta-1,4-galactosyltransferase galt-1-like [Haliotis rubra]XP_046552560.1 beta-1,4-galactosyltransferase galt-1-like [Haliotis rubra]XP_046552561.1 beta-1,4-galactosyltransferase galt-1-like [Haliotis rubra]
MRMLRVQRYTYYFILGVMAYLSLAYYIHFRSPQIQEWTPLRDTGQDTHSRPVSIQEKDGIRNISTWQRTTDQMRLIDASNYHGTDVHRPLYFEKENINIKLGKIKFGSVEFQNLEHIYVYAAFLDKRIQNKTYARIFALQRTTNLEGLLCRFYLGENKETALTVFTEKYEMCENHGKGYGGYIYTCQVPELIHDTPTTVSLSTYSTNFAQSNPQLTLNLTPLQSNSNSDSQLSFFRVCVPPIFGNIPLNILIQYIELTKILGGSKLFFYKYNVSKSVEKLLKYYTAKGDIHVLNWNLPPGVNVFNIWYNGQLLAIQDCLYRNMAAFKFLLFTDLDEILIPRQANNWVTMLHNMALKSEHSLSNLDDIAGFSFQSVFFGPNQEPDPGQTLQFLQRRDRTQVTSKIRSKLLIQPSHVFELGIHHMSRPIRDNMTVMSVGPDEALLHHYRSCVRSFDANMKCYPQIRDDTVLKYADLLNALTRSVMLDVLNLLKQS